MSPFDANLKITFRKNADGSWDLKNADVNRFGIGFGQKGFWGNQHFGTEAAATAEYERRLAELRAIYGTGNGRDWTGKFVEEEIPVVNDVLIRGVRFVPLKKNGKRGLRVHTVHLYRIEVSDERLAEIRKALPGVNVH